MPEKKVALWQLTPAVLVPLCLLLLASSPVFGQMGPAPGVSEIRVPSASPALRRYNDTWYTLYFVGEAWALLGLGVFLRGRLSTRLRDGVDRASPHRFIQIALFYAVFTLFTTLWRLPIGLYGFYVEHAYGFATSGIGLWLRDHAVGWLMGLVFVPVVWFALWLVGRTPQRWWVWLWAGSVPWMLATTVIYPVVVDPLYNAFIPIRNEALRDKLLAEAEHAGIRGASVYEVDISKRTKKVNAYVTGVGPTKRIVLWDTLIRELPDDEVLAVMGHEMGHYVLGHMWWRFAGGVVGAFVILWLFARLLPWAVARFGARSGIQRVDDLAAIPLAFILVSLLLFAQTPAESAFSRWQEHEADRFGLELTHANEATARAFVKFVELNYSDPDPPAFFVFWFYSHPPLRDRVAFALDYRPWASTPR